jgi:C4-dicarboxylate-specific signal transduction histidine kinase
LLVEDLASDDRFSQLSLIQNGELIRFYFGLPLISPEGYILGTLCVTDVKPRVLTGSQILSLSALSRQVIRNLMLRKTSMENFINNKTLVLGMFTFSMAHEINNALFASNGYLANAIKKCKVENISEDHLLHLISMIKKSNNRISKIVNGVKILSRNAENDPYESISVKKIIEETLSICEERCKMENILLSISLPVEDDFIKCHQSEIIQVLINLLHNSIDALSEVSNKWIKLEVEVFEDKVDFSVKDSGPGISEEIAHKLMQQFFTTKGPGKGTGLGLHICKSIIEQHSGQIYFDHSLPTKFGFTLPRNV